MERDASLDDFLDTDSGEDSETGGDAQSGADSEAIGSEEPGATPDASTVEPARSIGRWDPEGAVCDACGASVTRRWRETNDGDRELFVCVECKSW